MLYDFPIDNSMALSRFFSIEPFSAKINKEMPWWRTENEANKAHCGDGAAIPHRSA